MVYNCVTNLPEEYHRNWTIATSGQWSKPTPTLTQETKWEHVEVKRRDGGREGFHTNHLASQQELPALHMKHTFLPLIPMKSCRKRLLQRGEEEEVMWNGYRGHYKESLITLWLQLWSITPVKIHSHPWVDMSEWVDCLILFLLFVSDL